MLRCQALSVGRPGAGIAARPLRSGAARPQRCLVVAAAPPDGQPPSSRRPASRLEPLPAAPRLEQQPGSNGTPPAPHSAAHHGGHSTGAATAVHPGSSEAAVEPGSWEDWQRYFYEMDDIVNELESLYNEQEEAVAREDYRAAAALKAQREKLESLDVVGEAFARLDAAIAEERFEDAARLRDEASLSAVGWWVGRGSGDPCGHLLRITPDFSRFVGQVYTPRDLAEILPSTKSQSESEDMRARMLAALKQKQQELAGGVAFNPQEQQEEQQQELGPEDYGMPVMELFVRETEDGGYEQQAVALFAPELPTDEAEQPESLAEQEVANGIVEMIATDAGDGNVVSVERGQNAEGHAFVTIEISSLSDSGLTREEEELQARLSGAAESDDEDAAAAAEDSDDEDIRTIDDLAASVGVQPDDDASSSSSAEAASSSASASAGAAEVSEDEAEKLARWQAMAANLGNVDQELKETVEAIEQALMKGTGASGGGDSAGGQQWQPDGSGGHMETIDEALSQVQSPSDMGTFLHRAPAMISWHGRDCFTVSVSEPPLLREARLQREQEAAAAAAAVEEPPQLQRPPVRIIYDGKEQQRGQQPQGPDASGSGSSSSRRNPDGSLDVEVTAEESDSEEISVLLSPSAAQQQAQRAQQQQQDVAQPPASAEQQLQSEQEAIAADSAALADQIESLRGDMMAGRKPSQEKINEIAKRAMGLAIAQGMTTAAQADAASPERLGLEGQTTYQRVRVGSYVKTDPFSGMYLGSFGPHGPELLHVERQMEGGQEYVVATKLTGDPNVPAGAVSWKAAIGRNSRLPVEMYPPEMGVMARYRGQGQVAQTGFSNPKWVDGELLVFDDDNPFVQGAQLGFTYDVGQHQRFLIVLHRVNLDELFPNDV